MAVLKSGMARLNVSRRQLLQSSAAAAVIAVSYWADDRAAYTATDQRTGPLLGAATTYNRRTLSFFSADYATEHNWDLAAAVEVSRIGRDVAQIRVELHYDPRVLAARDVLIVEGGGEFHAVEAQEASIDELTARATYLLDADKWQQHRLKFSPPLIGKPLYPNDGIDSVLIPTVGLTFVDARGTTQTLTRALAVERLRPVAPWGIEVAPAWDVVSRTADGEEFYRAPVSLLVTATGPNPTPPGVQVEIRVPDSAAGAPSIGSYSDGGDELPAEAITSVASMDGAVRVTTLEFIESIPSGTRRSVTLDWPNFVAQKGVDAPPRALVRVATEGHEDAPRRDRHGKDTIVDMATAPAQVKQDLARKGG